MPGLPHSLHALVTGGGRGIGRQIASVLTQAGATVTVLGRDRAMLDDAVAAGAARFPAVADVAIRLPSMPRLQKPRRGSRSIS